MPELAGPVDIVARPEDVPAAAPGEDEVGRGFVDGDRIGEARMPISSTIRGWSLAMQSQSFVTLIRKLRNPILLLEMAPDVEGVFGHFLLDPLVILVPAQLDRAVLADDEALSAAGAPLVVDDDVAFGLDDGLARRNNRSTARNCGRLWA